jgi:hypothetical protein
MIDDNNDDRQKRNRSLLRVALRAAIAQVSDEQIAQGKPRAFASRSTKTNLENSQFRNLENLAYTTDKVSDITDLLKKSIGRDTKNQRWAKDKIGEELIGALDALRAKADEIVTNLHINLSNMTDPDLPRRVHLELCREFIKHLTAEFIYRKRELCDD